MALLLTSALLSFYESDNGRCMLEIKWADLEKVAVNRKGQGKAKLKLTCAGANSDHSHCFSEWRSD